MNINHLSNSEKEILEFLWRENKPSYFIDIMNFFNKEKGRSIKKQTLNNYISKLLKRELIERISKDRKYLYSPLITKEEFEKEQAEKLINNNYGGSLFNFVSALSGGQVISEEEAEKIRKILKG